MITSNHNLKVKKLVDEIKAICTNNGLGNDGDTYKIVTQSFLYKFLNDKFLFEAEKLNPKYKTYADLKKLSEKEYQYLFDELGNTTAELKGEHLLDYLFALQDKDDFAKTFDDTLNDISIQNSAVFSVHTAGNTDIRLFEERLLQKIISDGSKHNLVAKQIINALAETKFDEQVFSAGFDFFSTIFEYMIKDYNKDGGGTYAEYFTPHTVAKIMAEILVGADKPKNVKVYDPSAGSGTLLMNIASRIGTEKCTIYSQDINQKSSNLLRLNLILNNLTHSINNIVQGNTITESKHNEKMNYIVSNPPFKLDFSKWRNDIESLPDSQNRFFAGIPNIPNKDKNKMAIYLLFLQHIIYSLADNGKAAVVVPTGFITAQSGIEMAIRQKLVDNRWLKGVVSMPSNIFATTGTNVSVIFIDKTNNAENSKVVLVDASKLGTKVKEDGKNQKTILSEDEEKQIISAFDPVVIASQSEAKGKQSTEDFAVYLDYQTIKDKNYSLAAGQYFEIKVDYIEMTPAEFQTKISDSQSKLQEYFAESKKLETEILANLKTLQFNGDENDDE